MFTSHKRYTQAIARIIFGLSIFLFLYSTATATVIVRTADELEVVDGDIVDGELVGVGLPVVLSNNVAQDATLIGNRVTVNGEVGADLLSAGFFVDVNASVADDVRIIGGEVSLSSNVAGDVIILGGTVDILSTATILGDVVVYGGNVTITGSVGGDVVGVMESLVIDGSVGGQVDVDVTQLTLGQTASITEAVLYTSHNLVSQSINSNVGGEIVRSDPTTPLESNSGRMMIMALLVTLFTTLVWYLCSPKTLTIVVSQTGSHLLRSAFIGTVAPIVLFIVVLILFVSQLGSYVAFVLLAGLITLMLLAGAAAPAVIGRLILQIVGYPAPLGPLSIVIGSLLLTVFLYVPLLGLSLITASVLLGLGGMLEALFKNNK